MLPGGILLASLGLIGYMVERWRWGRSPHVTITELVLLLLVPTGAVLAVAGLVMEVRG